MTSICRTILLHRPVWRPALRSLTSLKASRSGDGLTRRGNSGPLRDMSPRIERMADIIDRFENDLFAGMETFIPSIARESMRVAMDVHEQKDKYIITADLPGMTKKDVKIQVTPDKILTISGERSSERKEEVQNYYRTERSFGKFFRSFNLPKNADENGIKAKASEGVLEITIPKTANEPPKGRTIDID